MKVVGLMSGTSGDGVDSALVDIHGKGRTLTVRLLGSLTLPYPESVRRRVLRAAIGGTVEEICHLNAVVGEVFAKAALKIIRQTGLRPSAVGVIGSHGQTLHHLPRPRWEAGIGPIRSTLQIGEPAIIAERTGILTIADFRPRDMAAGGQGAPLTSYVHHAIFTHPRRSRLIINLGGIGNVTYLPANGSVRSVRAFDTGPGNMVLDALVGHFTRGRQRMDRGGRLAGAGRIDQPLLRRLLSHPFLSARPPKSTGREAFGPSFVARVVDLAKRRRLKARDVLATCSLFTARTVAGSRRWLAGKLDEVIVGGGGARNRTLMTHLRSEFHPLPVKTFNELGSDSSAFEAVAFAVLAYETLHGRCSNVPSATGAKKSVILGAIVPSGQSWQRAVHS